MTASSTDLSAWSHLAIVVMALCSPASAQPSPGSPQSSTATPSRSEPSQSACRVSTSPRSIRYAAAGCAAALRERS
jgi:hypothetical protein